MAALVVSGGKSSESLLPSSVPYLQLDDCTIRLDCFDLEIDPDSVPEVFFESALRESE